MRFLSTNYFDHSKVLKNFFENPCPFFEFYPIKQVIKIPDLQGEGNRFLMASSRTDRQLQGWGTAWKSTGEAKHLKVNSTCFSVPNSIMRRSFSEHSEPRTSTCAVSVSLTRRLFFAVPTWWGCCDLSLWHKPTELAHSFVFCSCVCFCRYGPFNCISLHKFSRQLSAFLLCSSSGLISALMVLSTIYSLDESLPQPWYNPLWLTGLKAPINLLTPSSPQFLHISDPFGFWPTPTPQSSPRLMPRELFGLTR